MNPYLKELVKYNDAKRFAGSNIRTADGRAAYITSTGVAKMYPSDGTAQSTRGFNGCPMGVVSVDYDWSGPKGTAMRAGQSCGNEGEFVQAEVPATNFDWAFYTSYYTDLSGNTESQAAQHWNTVGKQEGRLPNENILSTMASVGKVGYVDPNAVMHKVAPAYTGGYKVYKGRSNVTGASMADCTVAVPSVKYGDAVYVQRGTLYGSLSGSTMVFSSQKSVFLLRPMVGGAAVQGDPIHYGDAVSIASSVVNAFSDACGWWGCKVGRINTTTSNLEFGAGGDTGGTPLTIYPPDGSAYAVGDEVIYGDPWSVRANVASPLAQLPQNGRLMAGQSITQGSMTFVYGTDGNVAVYQDTTQIWYSNSPHAAYALVMQNDGNLVAHDTSGIPRWSTMTSGKGTGPYHLALESNGVSIYDSTTTPIWSSAESSTVTVSPVVWYASAANTLSFSPQNTYTVFAFQPLQALAKPVCDVGQLKDQCNSDAACLGLVHSPADNTWQMMTESAGYAIAPTLQDFYVKRAGLPPDACVSRPPAFIDPTIFNNYISGEDFSSAQCAMTTDGLDQTRTKHQSREEARLARHADRVQQYSAHTASIDSAAKESAGLQEQTKKLLRQYSKVVSSMFNASSAETAQQQQSDAYVIDQQTGTYFIIWSLFAAVTVVILLKVQRN